MAKKKIQEVDKTPIDLMSSLLFIHRRRIQRYIDKRTDSRAELAALFSREGFIFELPVRFDELISAEYCGRVAKRLDEKFKDWFQEDLDSSELLINLHEFLCFLRLEREQLLNRVNEEIKKIWSGNMRDHLQKIENDTWMHFAIDIIPELIKDLEKLQSDYLAQLEVPNGK